MTDDVFFGGGLPDPSLHPHLAGVFAAVLRDEPAAYTYGGQWGHEGLRAWIAERLADRAGVDLHAGNVILTNGSAGALELLTRTLVASRATVITEALTYPGAIDMFKARDARLLTVPVDDDGMDVDALEILLQRETPAVVYTIATCHSPTGTTMSLERRERLGRLADRHGFTLIQDDTYGEIRFDGEQPCPLIGVAPQRVVHVGSFSKTLAPGLRLGWITATAELCAEIAARRSDLGATPMVQHAVARYLDDGSFEPHLAAIVGRYRAKRDVVAGALTEHGAAIGDWTLPDGGFFIWLTVSGCDVDELVPIAANEGVTYLGGPYFSAGERVSDGIRISYGEVADDRLEVGVHRLARAIARMREPVA